MSALAVLGFELLRPGLAPLLVAAPALALLALWSLGARRRARRLLCDARHEPTLLAGFSANRACARVALAVGALVLLVAALLGPVRGYTLREVERKGLDIVVCIDTSRSMLVRDLDPEVSRLEKARQQIRLLLERLDGDRVALVAFSGDARDVSPLTRDLNTVRWFLPALTPEDNRRGGTDVGLAIEHALELFDGRTGAHEAIVLLTDGEDLEGRGVEAAELAAERGIRVYVVGMGTPEGGKIPDERRGYVKDESGREVVSVLGAAALRAVADVTGGAYVSARTPLALERIYDSYVSQLEGRTYHRGKERIPHDRYQWPLVLALLCMVGEVALREQRPERPARADGRSRP